MTTKKIRIKHAPEFKAEALKLAEKWASLLWQDNYSYMSLKSMDGEKLSKKTQIPVIEKKS